MVSADLGTRRGRELILLSRLASSQGGEEDSGPGKTPRTAPVTKSAHGRGVLREPTGGPATKSPRRWAPSLPGAPAGPWSGSDGTAGTQEYSQLRPGRGLARGISVWQGHRGAV